MSNNQNDHQNNLQKWFGSEQSTEFISLSDLSSDDDDDDDEPESILSSTFFFRNKTNDSSDEVIPANTSICGTTDDDDNDGISSSLRMNRERDFSCSPLCALRGGRVTGTRQDKDNSSAPLLHVHQSIRKKNRNSTDSFSIIKKNDMSGTGSSSSYKSEKDSPTSFLPLRCFEGVGLVREHYVSATKRDVKAAFFSVNKNTSKQIIPTWGWKEKKGLTLTDLKCAESRGKEPADKEQNYCMSFPLRSTNKPILKQPSPTVNHDVDVNICSKNLKANVFSSGSKKQAYPVSTPFTALSKTRNHRIKKVKVAVLNGGAVPLVVASSSSPPLRPNKSVRKNEKQTHKHKMTGSSMKPLSCTSSSVSTPFDNVKQKDYQQKLENDVSCATEVFNTNNYITPLSSTPPLSTFLSTPLKSAIDSITYRDYSHVTPEDAYNDMVNGHKLRRVCTRDKPFPQKLHQILSDSDNKKWIAWLPHGRSWKILDDKKVEERILAQYFHHCKIRSFKRQAYNWGFKRVCNGPDENSYYHECFLRGLPHVSMMMQFQSSRQKSKEEYSPHSLYATMFRRNVPPNFSQISKDHPLPDENGELSTNTTGRLLTESSLPYFSDSSIVSRSSSKHENAAKEYATERRTTSMPVTNENPKKIALVTSFVETDPVQSAYDVASQQPGHSLPKNNTSISSDSILEENAVLEGESARRALLKDGKKESVKNLKAHSSSDCPKVGATNSRTSNSTVATRVEINGTIDGPVFTLDNLGNTILLNVKQLEKNKQSGNKRAICPASESERDPTAVRRKKLYNQNFSFPKQVAKQLSASMTYQ